MIYDNESLRWLLEVIILPFIGWSAYSIYRFSSRLTKLEQIVEKDREINIEAHRHIYKTINEMPSQKQFHKLELRLENIDSRLGNMGDQLKRLADIVQGTVLKSTHELKRSE